MRILFINTSDPPLPFGTGHQVHNYGNIISLIKLGHKVDLVIMSQDKSKALNNFEKTKTFLPELNSLKNIHIGDRNTFSLNSIKLKNVILELSTLIFRPEKYFMSIEYESVGEKISKLIKENRTDIIWYEDFYVGIYDHLINRNIPAIYNLHDNQANSFKNNNFEYFKNKNNLSNLIRYLILYARFIVLKKIEIITQKRCNIVFSGNSEDVKFYRNKGVNAVLRKIPVVGAKNNFLKKRKLYLEKDIINKKFKIIHLGGLNGSFTSASLSWFLDHYWLEIVNNLKGYEFDFHIIGGGEPNLNLLESFKKPRIIYRGYVDNLWDEFVDAHFMIVPGKIQTGVRIRVPTSLSMMVPVIGNKISFAGMDASDAIIVAESALDYSNTLKKYFNNLMLYKNLCENALAAYEQNYSIRAASKEIKKVVESL